MSQFFFHEYDIPIYVGVACSASTRTPSFLVTPHISNTYNNDITYDIVYNNGRITRRTFYVVLTWKYVIVLKNPDTAHVKNIQNSISKNFKTKNVTPS